MSDSKQEKLLAILRKLKASTGGDIDASAVVTTDGYMKASEMKPGTDVERFSSMCASLLALADHTTSEIAIGDMRQVMIMGTNGVMVLTHAGSDAVLAMSAIPKAKLGRVLLEAKNAASSIKEILD
ncbi:MAG: roadblock/LC7 domain-containing protein [Pseudomonadota bacterium]